MTEADQITELRAALYECMDKLWIARCDSPDEGLRQAVERAIKMADIALDNSKQRRI